MPIDVAAALRAEPAVRDLSWTSDDVLLYHLSLGAGGSAGDAGELRWIYERDLQVLPTFAVVAGGRTPGVQSGGPLRLPGVDIDLRRILHAAQGLSMHAPIPAAASARATSRVVDIWDKGKAAVIVTETVVTDLDGHPLWTATSQIWARGEGGFGGDAGPAAGSASPERAPDAVLDCATSAQTAALYRLNGDRNPLHIDPEFARSAGFDQPILHGLAAYGIVGKAVVDNLLDRDPTRVLRYAVRFAGVLRPGETIRVRAWRDGDDLTLHASCLERDDAPVLTHATMTVRSP